MIILAPKPRIEVRIWSMDYPEFALKRKKLTNTYLVSNFSIEILNNENHEVDQQRLSCFDWLLSWRLILEISGQLSSAKRRRVSKAQPSHCWMPQRCWEVSAPAATWANQVKEISKQINDSNILQKFVNLQLQPSFLVKRKRKVRLILDIFFTRHEKAFYFRQKYQKT